MHVSDWLISPAAASTVVPIAVFIGDIEFDAPESSGPARCR
jgi:hypothetical protein